MKNNIFSKQYDLFIGLDVSKGKADAAIYKRNRDRNVKSKFVRKAIKVSMSSSIPLDITKMKTA